jgi:hypothetical protein
LALTQRHWAAILACLLHVQMACGADAASDQPADQIRVAHRIIADAQGYAQGVRSDVLNLRPEHPIAIVIEHGAFRLHAFAIADQAGASVGPPDAPAAWRLDADAGVLNPTPVQHIVLPPRSGAVLYAPMPSQIYRADADPSLPTSMPIPDATYAIGFSRTLVFTELPVGTDRLPADAAARRYTVVRMPAQTFRIRASHQHLDPDWIRQWAR